MSSGQTICLWRCSGRVECGNQEIEEILKHSSRNTTKGCYLAGIYWDEGWESPVKVLLRSREKR